MNRSFLLIFAPAALVAATWMAMRYGRVVRRDVACAVAVVALLCAAIGWWRRRGSAA
jgi:predicted Co/Zn/Cd cation transporter (cation efflux family)